MTFPRANEQTIAASEHNVGMVWDGIRALRIALRIDPHIPNEAATHVLPEACRTWDQLSEDERHRFMVLIGPSIRALSCLQGHFPAEAES